MVNPMTIKEQIMDRLSLKKRNRIIWLYLNGMSYDEIAREADVTKAIAGCVILKLRTGQYPEFAALSEQIEILRKLTRKLRRLRRTSDYVCDSNAEEVVNLSVKEGRNR